jgi:hypothetical protein
MRRRRPGRFADRRIGIEDPDAVRLALAGDASPDLAARCAALRDALLAGAVTVPEQWSGAGWAP